MTTHADLIEVWERAEDVLCDAEQALADAIDARHEASELWEDELHAGLDVRHHCLLVSVAVEGKQNARNAADTFRRGQLAGVSQCEPTL